MASNKTYTLYKDADCTELATAQEVYDAYIHDTMRTVCPDLVNAYVIPVNVIWQDSNGGQDNATDVQGLALVYPLDGAYVQVNVGQIGL